MSDDIDITVRIRRDNLEYLAVPLVDGKIASEGQIKAVLAGTVGLVELEPGVYRLANTGGATHLSYEDIAP